jgi:transposase InsO family protein
MGQVLHPRARTTAEIRRQIQESPESLLKLSARFSINPKTVAKWRRRSTVEDEPMGPREVRSRSLSREEEALVVAFRRHTLLPLDDCLYALQETIPHLSRSVLHRCFQRHGISRLPPAGETAKPRRGKFAECPIGYLHIDIAELQTGEGRLYMFVAIDRTSKLAYAELHPDHTKERACAFLRRVIELVPYRIHTVLTDNGIQFTNRRRDHKAVRHPFSAICDENGTEHRLTKVGHPWTNGQVERMNRTIKEATVRRFVYETHEQIGEHLRLFLEAYNFGKRLKALRGLTPFEYIIRCWQNDKELFKENPHHFTLGLNIY